MQHQKETGHPDPIHVTAHFMRATVVGPFEVHVSVLKSGRGFTNLNVEFVQNVSFLFISMSTSLMHVGSRHIRISSE